MTGLGRIVLSREVFLNRLPSDSLCLHPLLEVVAYQAEKK